METPQLEHVYYHRDFDGVVSAAMVASLSNPNATLHPVNYDLKSRWLSIKLEQPAGIVDFLFHPDATLWVDHHVNPYITPEWKNIAKQSEYYIWDSNAPACPPLVEKFFNLPHMLHEHFKAYIHWSEIIDSASYESPQAATDLRNPYLLLAKVISLPCEDYFINKIVRCIMKSPIYEVISEPDIFHLAKLVRDEEWTVQEKLSKLIKYDGLIAFLDQSQEDWPYQRYYPYVLYPDAKYVVGIYKTSPSFVVSVGANPWKTDSKIDLGELASSLGGGGHRNVAGIPAESPQVARDIAMEVIEQLHAPTLSPAKS